MDEDSSSVNFMDLEDDPEEEELSLSKKIDFDLATQVNVAANILDQNTDVIELDDLFDDSEEISKKQKLAALRKLKTVVKKEKITVIPKKSKVSSVVKKRTRKSKKSENTKVKDPSIFPNEQDKVGLMAWVHSCGYNIVCNKYQGGKLCEKNREQVSDEIYALANLFAKRLNKVKDSFIRNFTKSIVAKGKNRGQDSAKMVALILAIKNYKRMITPLGEDLKPKSKSPWTNCEIDGQESHSECTRITIIPDDDNIRPLVFYEVSDVAKLYRAIHTLCHFGSYLHVDLERIVNKAKKTVDDDGEGESEDPNVIWEAVFDPTGSIPVEKKNQQEGTRLINLKQIMLFEMCETLRSFCEEIGTAQDPFKV